MRTLTLFFFFVFVTVFGANAQITEGNWMIGGDASFFSNKSESESSVNPNASETSYLILTSSIGYFFADKLSGGIGFSFNFVEPFERINSQNYSFAPFLRYYFLDSDKLVNIFSQVNYHIGFGKNGVGISNKTHGYGIKFGSALFFNSSVAMEFSLNYNRSKNTLDDDNARISKQFLIGLGFQIHLQK